MTAKLKDMHFLVTVQIVHQVVPHNLAQHPPVRVSNSRNLNLEHLNVLGIRRIHHLDDLT
jgi:hypothetical protein